MAVAAEGVAAEAGRRPRRPHRRRRGWHKGVETMHCGCQTLDHNGCTWCLPKQKPICKDTIEERILQRAKEKSEIQRMVIHGGSFKGLKQNELKPKEVVSLLLDDDEINRKIKGKVSAAEIHSDELELSSSKKPSNNRNRR